MAQDVRNNESIPPDRLGFSIDADHKRPTKNTLKRTVRSLSFGFYGACIVTGIVYYTCWVRPYTGSDLARDDRLFLVVTFTLLVNLVLHILGLRKED